MKHVKQSQNYYMGSSKNISPGLRNITPHRKLMKENMAYLKGIQRQADQIIHLKQGLGLNGMKICFQHTDLSFL